jgi:hypothetical protein
MLPLTGRGFHQSFAPFRPWLVITNAHAGLDRTDAFGVTGAAERTRLTADAIKWGGLSMADPFGREWVDAAGSPVLKVEAWCQYADRDENERSTGDRALCASSFVRHFLESQRCDLLCLVRLRRREAGIGDRKSRFWHTTLVVRIAPSLEVVLYPGHANALHESSF